MQIGMVEFAVGALAVWRITHLLHAEDGPWNLLARMRRRAGDGAVARMLDCFYCLSVWVALPVALASSPSVKARILLWPALSGAAILLERATVRSPQNLPLAEWHEASPPGFSEGENQ